MGNILIVEDNLAEAKLLQSLLHDEDQSLCLHHCETGIEAIEFLAEVNTHRRFLIDFILLDLNLPGMDGFGVLSKIRTLYGNSLPVIVLTTSQRKSDMARAYDLGANCFIPKPVNLKAFRDVSKSVFDFWIQQCMYPSQAMRDGEEHGY